MIPFHLLNSPAVAAVAVTMRKNELNSDDHISLVGDDLECVKKVSTSRV